MRKKLKIEALIVTLLFTAALFLGGCSSGNATPSSSASTDSDTAAVGNTPGNITNGGFAAQQGDWIYYLTSAADTVNSNLGSEADPGKQYLCKIKTDGTGKTQISSGKLYCLNVVGDWIYCVGYNGNSGEDYYLYKIKTDGTGKTQIGKDNNIGLTIAVAGNWIYYTRSHDPGKLYKIRTDGTGKTQINSGEKSDNIGTFNVSGGWIYYDNCFVKGIDAKTQMNEYNHYLYKIQTDGKGNTKLSGDEIEDFNVVDDWVYYIDRGDNSHIYKMKTDGTGKTQISSDKSSHINVSGNWIYFVNENPDPSNHQIPFNCLYKVAPDGTGETQVCSDKVEAFSILGDWIYYRKLINDSEIALYRVRTNGADQQAVN